eukprot:jgi/Astpho2/8083/e_gw1.00120.130.1_t
MQGCWTFAGGHGRQALEDAPQTLWAHAEAGCTTFDTGTIPDIYGPSERILGDFAREWSQAGKAPVQLLTKYVPNIFQEAPTPHSIEEAVRRSMASLKVEQLDLVQLHWWDYSVEGMVETAQALNILREQGLIRSIGLTNIGCEGLQQILDAGIPIVSNQVQFSLLDRRPLHGMLRLCEQHDIHLLTYGSLGGGLLSDTFFETKPRQGILGKTKYKPVDLNTSSLKMYWNVVNHFGGQALWRELLAVLHGIADKHTAPIANVALAWVMQQSSKRLVHPIVGVRGVRHIEDNQKALQLTLDNDDLTAIDMILKQSSGPMGDIYSFERE